MLQHATSWLADLPVGRKLLIGFGLICVLSLSAIGVGLYSASTLLASNRLGQDIATLNHRLLQARSAEKDYALTASQQRASQVRQQLGRIEQSLAILAPDTDRNHAQGLQLIRQSSHDYLQQFEAFVRQQQQARQAQVVMQEQADEARIQFEFVAMDMFTLLREALINDTAINHQATLSFAEDSSTLIRMMLAIRNREFGFVHDGDNESLEQWEALMQGSENAVLRLHERINEENRDILLIAQQALASYRQAFEHYRSNREASQHSARQMEKMADTVLEQAEQALEQHQQQMLVQGRRIMSTLVISAIVIMLLSLLASFTIRQMILAPLRQVLAAARRITSGDLSQDIGTDRRDEFGQLIHSMQGMTLNLRGLVQRIGKGIEQLNAAADQQQQVSQQSHEGAQAQKHQTDQAATAMEQMTATVAEVARNAEEASQAARQAHHEAVCGDQVVSRGADQVSHLATEVDSSMQAIQQLHQESERINGVLEVIKAVAEQTNLLALNAAIEAARAGEQGRGFAVVADEVRALARRTRQSTHEIEAMLQRLQNVSNQAVTRMTGSVELNHEAVAMTEEARQALGRITTAVSTIEQLNQQIAAAAEQQHAAATEVCRNVTHVRHIADESATANQHMRQSSMQLVQLGTELQVLVRQFRTD